MPLSPPDARKKTSSPALSWTRRKERLGSAGRRLRHPAPRFTALRAADHLDERLNVAQGKGVRLGLVRIAVDLRRMVRHDHAIVANLLVDAHGPDHVHIPVIGERLPEI